MSRVQLALNVSDLDEAVDFYSKLFGAEPAKRRPGYANFAIADPPLKLVLIEDADARGHGVAGALNHLGVEVATTAEVAAATGRLAPQRAGDRGRGADHLLLRRPGQGLGERPRRRPVGDLHRAGRRPGRVRAGRRWDLLHPRGRREPGVRGAGRPPRPAAEPRRPSRELTSPCGTPSCGAGCWPSSWAARFLAAIVIGSGIAAQTALARATSASSSSRTPRPPPPDSSPSS